MPVTTIEAATQVKRRYEQELLRKPNVVAVGVGYRTRGGRQTREVCILVSVRRKLPDSELAPQDRIPDALDGVPVDVMESGAIQAH